MECTLAKITVHYEEFGEGKPLIILPGWSLNAAWTAYELEPYFQHRPGWKRIYIDPPGHGKTPAPDWVTNQDDILGVVLACIDRLTAGQRYSLVGVSLGAYLGRGVRLYRGASIDGMALIVPAVFAEDEKRSVPPYQVVVEEPGIQAEITPAEADLYDMAVVHTRKWLDFQRSFPQISEQELGDAQFLSRIRDQHDKYAFTFDVDAVPEPFPGPSLIITGRQDAVVGYRDAWNILEKYPRATFVVFDRAGHMTEEKEDLINALLNEWLDRVEEHIQTR